jgi:hypothetical protein
VLAGIPLVAQKLDTHTTGGFAVLAFWLADSILVGLLVWKEIEVNYSEICPFILVAITYSGYDLCDSLTWPL